MENEYKLIWEEFKNKCGYIKGKREQGVFSAKFDYAGFIDREIERLEQKYLKESQ